MPASTISAVLKRIGMGKLGRLGLEPARRYERERPGELIHIDVKKLGRITRGAGKRVTGGTSAYLHLLSCGTSLKSCASARWTTLAASSEPASLRWMPSASRTSVSLPSTSMSSR